MGRTFPHRGGRAVDEHSEIYAGLDVAKARHAVAVANGERQGKVRYLGEIDADPAPVRRMVARLESGLTAFGRIGVRVRLGEGAIQVDRSR